MKRVPGVHCLVAIVLASVALPATARAEGASADQRRAAVETLREVIGHWQQGEWGKIYVLTTARSQKAVTPKSFSNIMERSGARLLTDDRALQVVEVSSKYPSLVEISVVLGYRHPRMTFKKETFQMVFEADRWKISAVAILYADPEAVPSPPVIKH